MQKELDKVLENLKAMGEKVEKAEERVKEIEKEKTDFIAASQMTGNRSTATESKALQAFGVSHPKKLLELNTADPKFGAVPYEYRAAVKELKNCVDTARWTAQIFYGAPKDSESDVQPKAVKNILSTPYGKEELAPRLKAFGSTVGGAGDEWVPTALSSQYIEEYELEKKVAQLFREIMMGTNPFELPVQNSVTTARLIAESAQISDANFGTAKITFSASKLAEHYKLPEELNEDSAPAIMQIAKEEVVEAILRAKESAILSGDTTATHMDADVTAGTDARKAWKGLRKLALANTATKDFSAAAVTTTNLDAMIAIADKFGINVRETAWIVSPQVYNQMVTLAEVTTVEKFGPMATILSGALAAFRGRPIIVSEFSRDDLNASGVQDGITVDRGLVHLVNHKRFMIGMRRPIRLRVMQDLPDYDRWLLSAYSRMDFQGHAQSASEKSVVLGFNVQI